MSGSRVVYHGTTALLEDAIRTDGLQAGPIAYVAGRKSLAEFYIWRAVGFALVNGLSTSREGLLVTLEIDPARLRHDPECHLSQLSARGQSMFFEGAVEPRAILKVERMPVEGRALVMGLAAAKYWEGWPNALPEGEEPEKPHPDEPAPLPLGTHIWKRRRSPPRRCLPRRDRESWAERRARIEREEREKAAATAVQTEHQEAWARELERVWMTAPAPIPDARRLLTATYASPSSPLHGAGHALEVAFAGVRLIEAGALADPSVVLAFAVLHDSQRRSEGHDPEHGARAAEVARDLHEEVHGLTEVQLEVLCSALVDHDRGRTSIDPTIGACWDADRLTLPRVGIAPRPEYLSTTAGRELAADPPELPTDASWEWISERLNELAQPAHARDRR